MNIGFDARKALQNGGAEGSYSRNLINYLSKFFPENNYFLFTDKTGRYHVKDFSNRESQVKVLFPEGTLHKFLPYYWLNIGIGKQIFENRLKIYHGLSGEVPAELPPGKKAVKIISLHNTTDLLDIEKLNLIDKGMLLSSFSKKIKKSDYLIVPSLLAAELVQEKLKVKEQKIFILGNPVAEDFFRDSNAPEKGDPFYYLPQEFLLTIASNDARSNIEILLEAYKRIYLQSITLLPLFIVGRESVYTGKLKDYARDLGIEKKVFFLPKVNTMLLRHLYKKANLVVIPTLTETSGHLLMETMAAQSNFLASDIPVHRELAPSGIPFFNPSDSDALTQLMTDHFTNPNFHDSSKETCKILSEGFNPQMFAKRLNDFYCSFD